MIFFKLIIVSILCSSLACTSIPEKETFGDTSTDTNIPTDTGKDVSKIEDQGTADFAATDTRPDTNSDSGDADASAIDLRRLPDQAEVTAPENFRAKFITSFGDFVVAFERVSAPKGIDRFYSLVKARYYEQILVFRAINNFMFQFGIHGEPEINTIWADRNIDDDPLKDISNVRGTISFANSGPNTRSNQLFISLADNRFLDPQGFTPLGTIVQGLENIDGVNTEYDENPNGFQGEFSAKGNPWALETYPNLSVIEKIVILE